MSVFDSLWERASALLDVGVDSVVGDRLRYRHNGVWLGAPAAAGEPAVVEAFVLNVSAPLNLEEIDETLGTRPRVKIAKALVDLPVRGDRIQHPRLGPGWFQPSGAAPDSDGRYWVFDVQECAAP